MVHLVHIRPDLVPCRSIFGRNVVVKRIIPVFFLSLSLLMNACGYKADLYLPEQGEKEQKQENNP